MKWVAWLHFHYIWLSWIFLLQKFTESLVIFSLKFQSKSLSNSSQLSSFLDFKRLAPFLLVASRVGVSVLFGLCSSTCNKIVLPDKKTIGCLCVWLTVMILRIEDLIKSVTNWCMAFKLMLKFLTISIRLSAMARVIMERVTYKWDKNISMLYISLVINCWILIIEWSRQKKNVKHF